jgi:diguanylate cyclase (GGDEF)-like protein/PAS domain S-box-containing protein
MMPEPVVIKDKFGKFVFCNEFVAQLYGTTPDKMLGKDDADFTGNKEQGAFFTENIQRIITENVPEMVYEDSIDTKTGETHHFHSLKVPFMNPFGEPNIIVIARDISKITIAKNNAEKDKLRLQCVLEVSEEGLWEWNTQTNEVFHNKKWELISGIERSQNSFQEFENCILDEDKCIVQTALERLLKDNLPYNIEFRIQRPDGKIIWVWDRGMVVESDLKGSPVWIVGIVQDITDKKMNQEKIEQLAYYDPLTHLPNRVLLDKKINEMIVHCNRLYKAVLFLDLDRFKLLNDTYGHHMGDRLLVQISKRLKKWIKNKGFVARFGGDEFVAVLSDLGTNPEQATVQAQFIAEQIRHELTLPIHLSSEIKALRIEYRITASIGGVIFKSGQTTLEKLLQLADLALYQVKADGRNDAVIFDLEMQKELHHTSSLQKSMQASLDNGDFCIYLQPKYDFNEKITGAECLVRWNHPVYGLVGPVKFIGIAEDINLIIPLGNHVLHLACKELEKWQSNVNTEHLTMAVNLSAKQIWHKEFVDTVINIIEQYSLDQTKLTLEVTETMLLHDINDAIEKLTQLKNYGIRISLDDFGTGYSSLSYLKSLPIDEIKIDRSFVNDIINDQQANVMVKSIVDLGNNFNLGVVSEGVETKAQYDLLKSYGITCYQGFYFSKPLPINDFDLLLKPL